MRTLVLLALGALLTGCASPQPTAQDTSIQQSAESLAEIAPESAEAPTAPEADPGSEGVDEEAEEVVSAQPSTSEARPQETVTAAPAATKTPRATASAAPAPTATATPTQTPTSTPAPAPTATESRLSMANIAKNNSAASCWVAISGSAYDLTRWIANHPGGASAITSICGTDATSVFQARHGGQAQPASALDSYLLGAVGS